jgi:hypothetical protein
METRYICETKHVKRNFKDAPIAYKSDWWVHVRRELINPSYEEFTFLIPFKSYTFFKRKRDIAVRMKDE